MMNENSSMTDSVAQQVTFQENLLNLWNELIRLKFEGSIAGCFIKPLHSGEYRRCDRMPGGENKMS